jgi:hypothetical protein
MFQTSLTVSAGKRLIALAVAEYEPVKDSLLKRTIVIIAGTTNGYVAEELLKTTGQNKELNTKRFFRGVILPPGKKTEDSGRLPDESQFPGDVVLVKGAWQKGKEIFDVVDDLKKGDIILKGANCINLESGKAGLLIGHPKGGTIVAAMQAVVGRRVRLLIPSGLEKRISADIDEIALKQNVPGNSGPRLFPVPSGEIITELEAIRILAGAVAELTAAGGVCGAEGSVWITVRGTFEQEEKAKAIIDKVKNEPAFIF